MCVNCLISNSGIIGYVVYHYIIIPEIGTIHNYPSAWIINLSEIERFAV